MNLAVMANARKGMARAARSAKQQGRLADLRSETPSRRAVARAG